MEEWVVRRDKGIAATFVESHHIHHEEGASRREKT